MAGPNLNELRKLALVLPPNERLAAGEVADVVSAVVAVITHGKDLLAAAEKGNAGVLDFYHEHAVQQAKDAGNPAPERGFVVTEAASAPAQQTAGGIDYDKLAAAIVRAERNAQQSNEVDGAHESAPVTESTVTPPVQPEPAQTITEHEVTPPDEGII